MALQYGHGQISTLGLVLNLDAADRNSYPGSGTTWYDLSGNGNNGTLTNGPTFTSPGYFSFDGTDALNFPDKYDRILIDAPCTGLGALRRRPEARWRKNLKDLKELVILQRNLLASSYDLLNAGGIMAYVTCSPHLAETKGQLLDFLSEHKDMKILPINEIAGSHEEGVQSDGSVQLWTHLHQSDAMFMVLLKKVG